MVLPCPPYRSGVSPAMALSYSSTSCLPAGSRRLLTPSPSSRSGRETKRSRPSNQRNGPPCDASWVGGAPTITGLPIRGLITVRSNELTLSE